MVFQKGQARRNVSDRGRSICWEEKKEFIVAKMLGEESNEER